VESEAPEEVQMHGLVRRAALPLALLGAAIAASPAGAAPPDPQTTNVPYLAWRGEHVRLVKCAPEIALTGQTADVIVEDWSGADPARSMPEVVAGSVKFFNDDARGLNCVRATLVAVKAGIAPIKLIVSDAQGNQVLTHQFQAAWLNLNTPTLHEVAATDQTGDPWLGDPLGDGNFVAGGRSGRVQVTVTGTLPLLGNYAELGLGPSIGLPAGWPALAKALATDASVTDLTPWMRWDIHDDDVLYPLASMDMVDGVMGNPFQFYRKFFGDLSANPSIGPFDPERPNATLLSDGKLDAADAPMPAARVDVAIAPNSGAPGDISGVGSLGGVSKQRVYSRDHTGNATDHNIYAPFNAQYIPATAAPSVSASGIDGEFANNFNGFLVKGGLYYNWDVVANLVEAMGGNTNCLLRRSSTPLYDITQWDKVFRQRPYGPQDVVVYTDEHGEAQVTYTPGTGMFFDNLGAIMNDNGGCDLQGIDPIGTSSITATAKYPYQPVTDPAKTSRPLVKVVHSLFDKSMTYWPKGPGAANDVARIVVAHAQDITGIGFGHERVCFMGDALVEGMKVFTGTTGPVGARINLAGSYRADDPEGMNRLCAYTNRYGNAAVEIFNSNRGVADIIADYVDEGILRDVKVNFNIPGSSSQTPSVTAPPTPVALKPAFTLGTVRLMTGKSGRYVVVRVNSKKKRAVIRIRLSSKSSHLLRAKTITIRTNRLVKISTKTLRVPKATKKVNVRVLRVR
jgi:hypothetical protein